jgi:hypothetical protein
VTVPGAGHLLPYEQPAAVLDLLAQQHIQTAYRWPAASATCGFGARPRFRPGQSGISLASDAPFGQPQLRRSGRSATKHAASARLVPVTTMSGFDPTARRTSLNSESRGAHAGTGGTADRSIVT